MEITTFWEIGAISFWEIGAISFWEIGADLKLVQVWENNKCKQIRLWPKCWACTVLVVKINFALPIQSEKQNAAEAVVPDLLKFFKTLLNL